MKIGCLKKSREGVILDIEVTPFAKKERIKGYDPWRKRLLVEMREKPEKFKVNNELVEFFAKIFYVSKDSVFLVSGEKSTKKSMLIKGVSYEDAEKIIAGYL